MNTEDLVDQLSAGLTPVSRGAPARRLALALGVSAVVALAAMLATVGPRPDLSLAMTTGAFWMKAAYTLGLVAGGFYVVESLSRPGGDGGRAWGILAAVASLAVILAGVELFMAPPGARMPILMGHSSGYCLPRIVGLSVPVFAGVLWAMRALAPTRLRLAGFAAGLLAGGVGATVYGLSCVESTAAFMAAWYSLGVLIVGVLGALVGPRLLRW